MDRARLIAFAQAYLSFLFPNINKNEIDSIVLFGSAARGEATKESDVDIFLEATKADKVKRTAEKALSVFKSSELYEQWKLRGVENEIQLHAGKLDKLSDLKRSLLADGIVLYGKYNSGKVGEHYVLFAFDAIKNKAKRYRVERYLFGRNERARKTKGVVELFGGKKLTTRSFFVPSLKSSEIVKNLKREKVDFAMFDMWMML